MVSIAGFRESSANRMSENMFSTRVSVECIMTRTEVRKQTLLLKILHKMRADDLLKQLEYYGKIRNRPITGGRQSGGRDQ